MAQNIAKESPIGRTARAAACVLVALALLLIPTASASAGQPGQDGASTSTAKAGQDGASTSTAKGSSATKGPKGKAQKRRARARRMRTQHRKELKRVRRANRGAGLTGNRAVGRRPKKAARSSGETGVLDAGFENGLFNWNTAGVGEVIPTVTSDNVRSGASSGRFALTGTQHRSELILGGNGNGSVNNAIRFHEGDEKWYAFSFYIDSMTYGEPGAHNLIMQFKGDDEGSPYFGLQLWDYEGDEGESGGRGLWSHGKGMDGDRFLSPVAEHRWHDVVVHFKASSTGDGFYEVSLNGTVVDSASGVSMIPSYADHAYIKSGLYRNGDEIPGTAEIRLDAVKLGPSLSSVAPS